MSVHRRNILASGNPVEAQAAFHAGASHPNITGKSLRRLQRALSERLAHFAAVKPKRVRKPAAPKAEKPAKVTKTKAAPAKRKSAVLKKAEIAALVTNTAAEQELEAALR